VFIVFRLCIESQTTGTQVSSLSDSVGVEQRVNLQLTAKISLKLDFNSNYFQNTA